MADPLPKRCVLREEVGLLQRGRTEREGGSELTQRVVATLIMSKMLLGT